VPAPVRAFEKLVDTLRGERRDLRCIAEEEERGVRAVQDAEKQVQAQKQAFATKQGAIKRHVASHVDRLGKATIECLEKLPDAVQAEMTSRDELRSRQIQDLRLAMLALLRQFNAAAKQIVSGWTDVGAVSDFEKGLKAMLEAREEQLKKALDEACAGAAEYNRQVQQTRCAIGEKAVDPELQCPRGHQMTMQALEGYDEWVRSYSSDDLVRESDQAMACLNEKLAKSLARVLGLQEEGPKQQGGDLKGAFRSAGLALKREREHRLSDAVAFFPAHKLMDAGRRLLEAWQAESDMLRHLVRVWFALEKDLEMHKECLKDSGSLSKKKDDIVQQLATARQNHQKVMKAMKGLESLEDDEIEGYLKVKKLPAGTTGRDLKQRVQETLKELISQTLQLTGAMAHPVLGEVHIQNHFPEVMLYIGQGLPPDLGVLWRPAQTLDSFDSKELLPTDSNHKVWRVKLGDEQYAIKEFAIGQPRQLQTCLKEAAVIYRHRHPSIVEVKAIFQGSGSEQTNFYIQMPWYEHGALEQWIAGQQPSWRQVREVLLDALLGLSHLHASGVIHGDVKPANILVDGRQRGRLADFDISIDTKNRTARVLQTLTMRGTAQGMTLEFAAPELQTSMQATRQTDVFAFGATLAHVRVHCEPDDAEEQSAAKRRRLSRDADRPAILEQARGQTDVMVSVLTAQVPKSRPSAEAAMQLPFFTTLKEACKRVSKACVRCEQMGKDAIRDATLGVECSEGHFHCALCLEDLTADFMDPHNVGLFNEREGRLKCSKYPSPCTSGFADHDLATTLPVLVFQDYSKAREETLKVQIEAMVQTEMKAERQEELDRLAALADTRFQKVVQARQHIVGNILNRSCPGCGQTFSHLDFEGCFALKCKKCPCRFCAWCLVACGNDEDDARAHLAQCPAKPPGQADIYYGSMQQFQEALRHRQKEMICAYLEEKNLSAILKSKAVEACRKELEEHQLRPMDFLSPICQEMQRCREFLNHLGLDSKLFDPEHDRCYCASCVAAVGRMPELLEQDRPHGSPYEVPLGWCGFGLQVPARAQVEKVFEDWAVSFHGCPSDVLSSILREGQLLMPGDTKIDGSKLPNRLTVTKGNDQRIGVYTSGSIKYSELDIYTKPASWENGKVRTVLQCRQNLKIEPPALRIEGETIGWQQRFGNAAISRHFANDEIERFTRAKNSIIPYRILVSIDVVTREDEEKAKQARGGAHQVLRRGRE
jgi:serine/threonine protein kinase